MKTIVGIKHAIEHLPSREREALAQWLQELATVPYSAHRVAEAKPSYRTDPAFMTLDAYMEFEEQSSLRHEYVNGTVYAMNGPSVAHARIARQLLVAFDSHLRGGPCEPFATDLKLQIRFDTEEIVYYPDVMVACNPDEWGKNYLTNPKLVLEILSPSTQHIDRREKAMTYRRVASVEEYVLLAQDEDRVIVHRRHESWRPQLYAGSEAVAEFHSIGLRVPLAQIYAGTL